MNFDSDTNVVDVAIKRLRAKIDHPFDIKLIHTVRSIGYSFGESRLTDLPIRLPFALHCRSRDRVRGGRHGRRGRSIMRPIARCPRGPTIN